jgi:imidazolonepropionase
VGAKSVDHLEHTTAVEWELLRHSDTVPTLLPGTAFFLGIPYPQARDMISNGLGVALASDFNQGTCPSGNMSFILSLACLRMGMLPRRPSMQLQ